MGGRGGAGGENEKWMKSAANWETWARWKYQHPFSSPPDSIDKLVSEYNKTNASYMKSAVGKSKYLTYNEYTNVASYSDPEFSVSVKAPGGGGGGIQHGVVLVDITVPGEKVQRSFFQTHKQSVAFADKEIKRRRSAKRGG